ncbi:DNA cytosine methyltransferase [Massilia sp. W12]|uniref:DNA cytosine methyltransferase n=1 Tax=Massilia sp. W12 TaxID=3126507 RepID=UPI0030CBC6DA
MSKQSQRQHRPGCLEFFAGSGLVSYALRDYFEVKWANDICAKKGEVYRANHGAQHFHLGSIANVRGADLPPAALSWASFPCQDLSLAGNTAGIHASRSGLVWEWLRVLDEMPLRPAVLTAENVAGLVSANQGAHYRALHHALQARGYRAGALLLDAVRWLPQSRPRVFVIALRADIAPPPELCAAGPQWPHPAPIQQAAAGLQDWIWWRLPAPPARTQDLADLIEWDAPCQQGAGAAHDLSLIAPAHKARLQSLGDCVAPGYKRTRNGRQVLELRFDGVAGCLRTPGGGSSRQYLVLQKQGRLHSRLLTARETARLMGAPEHYQLPGSYNAAYKAMGDAVAAPVAAWLAQHLLLPLARLHEA